MKKEHCIKDEQILAAILAAAHVCGRSVRPDNSHDGVMGSGNAFGIRRQQIDGPACAVGAGVLYSGIAIDDSERSLFAMAYGVTVEYADGISDGFENSLDGDAVDNGYRDVNYIRGYHVGQAAFQIMCLNGGEA